MAEFTGTFDGVQIFSATMAGPREMLGDQVTKWLEDNVGAIVPLSIMITQSSDTEFHCVTMTVLYTGKQKVAPVREPRRR